MSDDERKPRDFDHLFAERERQDADDAIGASGQVVPTTTSDVDATCMYLDSESVKQERDVAFALAALEANCLSDDSGIVLNSLRRESEFPTVRHKRIHHFLAGPVVDEHEPGKADFRYRFLGAHGLVPKLSEGLVSVPQRLEFLLRRLGCGVNFESAGDGLRFGFPVNVSPMVGWTGR